MITTHRPALVTRSTLSDGREIIYFDREPTPRTAVDHRGLESDRPCPDIRFDVLQGEWVASAAHRQTRIDPPGMAECPLCPTKPGRMSEIPEADYEVVVFENRFPSFGRIDLSSGADEPDSTDVFRHRRGGGRCEVVVFSPNHTASLVDLPPQRLGTILDAWIQRTEELMTLPGIVEVFPFENRGAEIGATLPHPHGQLYAYPFLSPRTAGILGQQQRWAAEHHECLGCRLAAEEGAGPRVIASDEHWIAYVPYAARWPFEVHVRPRQHRPSLVELSDAERESFPAIYLKVLRGLDDVYGMPMAYTAGWHQRPVDIPDDGFHLFLQLSSIRRAPNKLKFLAGSEAIKEVFINDISAERAAAMLRGEEVA